MQQPGSLKRITWTVLGLLASALFYIWRNDIWHKIPDLAIVMTGVIIPVAIVLAAVYWASQQPTKKQAQPPQKTQQ